jgi:hypothetical protein
MTLKTAERNTGQREDLKAEGTEAEAEAEAEEEEAEEGEVEKHGVGGGPRTLLIPPTMNSNRLS